MKKNNAFSFLTMAVLFELGLMYENLKKAKKIGGFSNDVYWSSSRSSSAEIWWIDFSDGKHGEGYYTKDALVRAARQF